MRARNVKPGFLKNEDLADIGPCAQLLFMGLWQIADREGKLEDRPRRIKAEIFPYYEPKPSVEILLNHLVSKQFILRYKVGSLKLLKIANFTKHQSPHHTEKRSIYPEPCESPLITSDSPYIHGEPTVSSPGYNGEYPPDSLNHESGIMNHESGIMKSKDMPTPLKKIKKEKTPIPEDFGISDTVRTWAQKHGFGQLDEHLSAFKRKAAMNGYVYLNWDMAFMEAIREDWAKIRKAGRGAPLPTSQTTIGGKYDGIGTTLDSSD